MGPGTNALVPIRPDPSSWEQGNGPIYRVDVSARGTLGFAAVLLGARPGVMRLERNRAEDSLGDTHRGAESP